MIKSIQNFYKKNGCVPKKRDFDNKNDLPSYSYTRKALQCDSIADILLFCGLKPEKIEPYNKISKDFALEQLKQYYNILNKIPTVYDFKVNKWTPDFGYYAKYFGSYQNACFEAGLIDSVLNNDDRIQISINELIKLSHTLGRCPRVFEFDKLQHRGYSRRSLERKLDLKYNEICKKYLDYDINHDLDISKEKIIEDINNILLKFGRAMTYEEMKMNGLQYSYTLFKSKCNMTYNQIIEYLGWKPVGSTTVSKSQDILLDEFYQYFKFLGRIPYFDELNNNNITSTATTYCKYFGSIKNVCDILDIDYELYYENVGAGKICLDNNNEICKSLIERDISNYFIDKSFKFEKETAYSELIPYMKQRFDWKLYIGDKVYYIEYFGLYNNNPRGNIDKKYLKRARYKIKKLYQHELIEKCIFLFPNDIKLKSLDEIFIPYINKIIL